MIRRLSSVCRERVAVLIAVAMDGDGVAKAEGVLGMWPCA